MKFYNILYTTKDYESSFIFWQNDDLNDASDGCKNYLFFPEYLTPDSPSNTSGISVKLNGDYHVSVYKKRLYEKELVRILKIWNTS